MAIRLNTGSGQGSFACQWAIQGPKSSSAGGNWNGTQADCRENTGSAAPRQVGGTLFTVSATWGCNPIGSGDRLQDDGSGNRAAACSGRWGSRARASVHPNRCSDAYTRTSRPALIKACEHVPSMLNYHRMAYGGEARDGIWGRGDFVMMWQGALLGIVKNRFSV